MRAKKGIPGIFSEQEVCRSIRGAQEILMKTGEQKRGAGSRYLERPWLKSYPEGLPADIDIPGISLVKAFDEAVERWKDKTALIFYGKKISYLELKDHVDRFAAALHGLGVRKGERVALFLVNSPQFVIAYFGALKIGAVLTAISPVYVTPEVKHQLEDSRAETIVCEDVLYDFVQKTGVKVKRIIITGVGEYLPGLKRFISGSFLSVFYQKRAIPRVKIERGEGIYRFQDLIGGSRPDPPAVEINPKEDLAVLAYTAGTTEDPRGVMLTHRNLLAAQAITGAFWAHSFDRGKALEEGKETVIAVLPFYHIYGQTFVVIGGLIQGYTLVTLTTPDLDDILNCVAKYKATFLMGVPSLYGLLANYERTDRIDWSGMKLAVSAADSLPEGMGKDWERRTGVRIHEGYGLTETAPAVCSNPSGRYKPGSFGVPLPNTMVAIAHPDKAEFMPFGEIGELVVKGPQVMKGYWERPGETEQSFEEILGERWLRTGDLARIDDEGYFYFYDRKKDLIKSEGYSIFAREIEEVLRTHPKIKEAAVIGVPDEKAGANIKAVIVLQADARGKVSEQEIAQYCADKLAQHKIPKIIEFRGEIPRTDVGKVSRRELREEGEA
jgi:long-chain acyl-CoA synthetase